MPFYSSLKRLAPDVRKRAARGLLDLRKQLAADGVPPRTSNETLLLASWNIREFDSEKYGPRCDECFYYIAEIISHFDLVAVQEVREDLSALDRVQEILGGWWKYIVTDVTEGTSGNGERMAFMYDSRKITFAGLAGEIVLPEPKGGRVLQFARTPFLCGFKAGWTRFNLCTVHLYYGTAKPDDPRRLKEIQDLAAFLAKRAKGPKAQPARPDGKVTATRNGEPENLILLGDFNIFGPDDATMHALLDAGFTVPDELRRRPGSNLAQDKFYDQIAFMTRPRRFGTTGKAGVFDYYRSVFRKDDHTTYGTLIGPKYGSAKDPARLYNDWRTFQMSDHLLLWVELRIDYADEYLQNMHDTADGTAPTATRIAAAEAPSPSGNGNGRKKKTAAANGKKK